MDLKSRWVAFLIVFLAGCSSVPHGEGHADQDSLDKVMKAHAADFKACYDKSPAHKVGLVESRFKIDSSGSVVQASIYMSTLEDPDVEACLVERIKSLSFASPVDGDEAQVLYPFKFAPPK